MAAVKISSARRQAAQKFRAPQHCSFSNINRAAGPYGVRDRRHGEIRVGVGIVAAGGHAGRGSGSGDRIAGDSVRNSFAPQLQLDGRKSKDHGSLAAFFSIFLSLLKEIWPPEA